MPMHKIPSPVSPSSSRRGKGSMDYVTHHPKYYLVGGDLYVLIEGVMFKIHSYFFKRESKNFFDDPLPPGPAEPSSPEIDDRGTSESRAIRISDVSLEEFEQFLWVFYNPRYDTYDADVFSWFTILKLAHRWDFPIVRDFALRELKRRESEIPLVQRICLYQEYEAPLEFLVPLFAELCSRESGLTDEEMVELGYEQACFVWRARECLRFPDGVSSLPDGVTQEQVYTIVSDVMGLPTYKSPEELAPTTGPSEAKPVSTQVPDEHDDPQPDKGSTSKTKSKTRKNKHSATS